MVLAAIRMTQTGPRIGHETRIKPVMELNFPRVDARVYHWFIQKVCQQGNDEGKQRKPDLKSKESSEETQEVAGHPTSKELKVKRFEYSSRPGLLTLTPKGPKETGTVH